MPKITEFIIAQHSEILIPFPFSPPLRPGKLGPIYEMRIYTVKPGTLPEIRKAWEAKLPERLKLSLLAVVGSIELGEVNPLFISGHIAALSSVPRFAPGPCNWVYGRRAPRIRC